MDLNKRIAPYDLQGQAAWLDNLTTQFAQVAVSPLGFVAADVTALTNDNEDFQFCAQATVEIEAYAKAFRQYRATVTKGRVGEPTPSFPPNPGFAPPNAVPTGIFERVDELIKRIKAAPAYTPEIGVLLGIIPDGTVRPVPEDMQPTLKVRTLPGSVVQVKFTRGATNGIFVETKVDNSDTWSSVGIFPSSPAIIVVPQNAENLPRAVQVRARYVEGNSPIGEFSPVMAVSTQPSA
jgi:hypothetical protein